MTGLETIDRDELLAEAKAIPVTLDNVVDYMDRYVAGKLTDAEIVATFQFLVDSGIAWTSHPLVAEAARYAINHGLVTETTKEDAHDD
jgi:hypothetical protein